MAQDPSREPTESQSWSGAQKPHEDEKADGGQTMKTLLLLILTISLKAQTLTATLSSPFAYQGSTINLTVSFADATPTAGIAGFQWTLSMPPGFTLGTPTLGAASIAAAKTVTCTNGTCLVSGTTQSTFLSGLIATFPVTVTSAASTGPWAVSLSSLLATNASGTNAPITFSAGGASVLLPISVNPPQGVTTWFSYTSGNNTITVKKVPQVPMKISYVSSNPYGSESGSYSADPTNGGAAGNIFMVRAGSTDPSEASATCFIALNSTNSPLVMGALGTVPASSGAYSCAGTGNGSISWP
jgi:hypothetical protein